MLKNVFLAWLNMIRNEGRILFFSVKLYKKNIMPSKLSACIGLDKGHLFLMNQKSSKHTQKTKWIDLNLHGFYVPAYFMTFISSSLVGFHFNLVSSWGTMLNFRSVSQTFIEYMKIVESTGVSKKECSFEIFLEVQPIVIVI